MGTAKRGGATSAHTKTTLNFKRPAGRKLTLLTLQDQEVSTERAEAVIAGDGSVAPIAIARGQAEGEYSFTITQEEFALIAAVAKAAGIEVTECEWDATRTTSVPGQTKMTERVTGMSPASVAPSITAEGNRMEISGMITQYEFNGTKMWKEAQ